MPAASESPRKAVVLLSGGLDSCTAAAMAKAEGFELYALTVAYGQRHAVELEAARRVAAALGVARHVEVRLDLAAFGGSSLTGPGPVPKDRAIDEPGIPSTYVPARNTVLLSLALAWAEALGVTDIFIGVTAVDYSGYPDCRPAFIEAFEGSSLTGPGPVPKDRATGEPGIPSTYVPARNTVLLSLALAWAEALGATDIFIGVNAVDYSGYPDCRPAFIEAFERMASLATKAGVEGARFTIHAPLIAMTKGEIIRRGLALGVDYGLTRSCYDPGPGGAPCGRCDSCALRARGFAEAGVPDPGAEDQGLHRVGTPTLPGGAEGKAGP